MILCDRFSAVGRCRSCSRSLSSHIIVARRKVYNLVGHTNVLLLFQSYVRLENVMLLSCLYSLSCPPFGSFPSRVFLLSDPIVVSSSDKVK